MYQYDVFPKRCHNSLNLKMYNTKTPLCRNTIFTAGRVENRQKFENELTSYKKSAPGDIQKRILKGASSTPGCVLPILRSVNPFLKSSLRYFLGAHPGTQFPLDIYRVLSSRDSRFSPSQRSKR